MLDSGTDFEVYAEKAAKSFKILNRGVTRTDLPVRRTTLAALWKVKSPGSERLQEGRYDAVAAVPGRNVALHKDEVLKMRLNN